MMALTSLTTASVEAAACLMIMRYVARLPLTRTTLVCTECVLVTGATSPSKTGVPLTTLIGNWLKSATRSGLPLSSTLYSRSPIFTVPAGMMTLVEAREVPTSCGERPLAYSSVGCRLTITARLMPPSGAGDDRPSMVKSLTRMKLRP